MNVRAPPMLNPSASHRPHTQLQRREQRWVKHKLNAPRAVLEQMAHTGELDLRDGRRAQQ